MKTFLIKKGTIIGFSIFLLIIFIFGGMYSRYMTNQIDVHENERFETSIISLVDNGVTLSSFESNGSDESFNSPSTGDSYTPELIGSYQVFNDNDEAIAYVYVIESKGNADGVVAAYAISLENNQMIGVEVISHQETTSVDDMYYNLLTDEFFDRFEQKDLDVIDFSIDTISGATYSSLAFEQGMKYARELYANDTDFEIVSLILNIVDLQYNFNLTTLNDYTYIVDVTYGEDLISATVALNNDFEYVSTLSGQEPSQSEIEALPSYVAEADDQNMQDLSIESYDDTSRTIRLVSRGYSQPGVTVDVVLNASLDAVETINFVDSTENYDNEYNGGYDGADAPIVEEDFIDQYNADGTIIDAVSGATVTSGAMTRVLEWATDLETSLNGGN